MRFLSLSFILDDNNYLLLNQELINAPFTHQPDDFF